MASSRARACRRCGKRQRIDSRALWLGLAGLTLASMFAFAGFGPSISLGKGSDDTAWQRPASPAAPEAALASGEIGAGAGASAAAAPAGAEGAAIEVTAPELSSAYAADGPAADRRYRGKRLSLTASLTAVPARDFRGDVVLRLGSDDTLEMVRATLKAGGAISARAMATPRGARVSLTCTGRGALIGEPILEACSFR